MTTINLSYGYFIDIDPLNYILKRKYIGESKDGKPKEVVKTYGYYGSVESALERYIELRQLDVLDGERVSLDEYVKTIERVNKDTVRALQDVMEASES